VVTICFLLKSSNFIVESLDEAERNHCYSLIAFSHESGIARESREWARIRNDLEKMNRIVFFLFAVIRVIRGPKSFMRLIASAGGDAGCMIPR
jgi:hypothetical protein